MGRDRGQQRVKGNLRAASSAAAATQGTPFLGFSAFADVLPTTASTASTESSAAAQRKPLISPDALLALAAQPDIAPDIAVGLKALAKRDASTRVRGLAELAEKDIASLISIWGTVFPRLALDADRRVRLGAVQLHAKLAPALATRQHASTLKTVLPAWLIARFDDHRDVARAASEALESSFPAPEKRTALFKFASDPLVHDLAQFALSPPDLLTDPRYHSPDERPAVVARICSGSIRALADVAKLAELPPDMVIDIAKSQLSSDLLSIRRATCALLSATAASNQNQNWLLEVVLGTFSERECPIERLEATISILAAQPNIFSHLTDQRKRTKFIKTVLEYLKNPPTLVPNALYPALIVVVSRIPHDLLPLQDAWTALRASQADSKAYWRCVHDLLLLLSKVVDVKEFYLELLSSFLSAKISEHAIQPLMLQILNRNALIQDVLNDPKSDPHRIARLIQNLNDPSLRDSIQLEFDGDLHRTLAICSALGMPVPPSNLPAALEHCSDCLATALAHTSDPYEAAVWAVENARTHLLHVPTSTPHPLTEWCLANLETVDDIALRHADRHLVLRAAAEQNVQHLAQFAHHTRDPVVAAWVLRFSDDAQWKSANIPADLVINSLVDDLICCSSEWPARFERAGNPYQVVVDQRVKDVLAGIPTALIAPGIPDIIDPKNQPTSSSPTELLAPFLSRIDANPLSQEWVSVLCLVGAKQAGQDIPISISPQGFVAWIDELTTRSSDLTTAELAAVAWGVRACNLSIPAALPYLDVSPPRLIAAILAGLPTESAIVEHHLRTNWLPRFFEGPDLVAALILAASHFAVDSSIDQAIDSYMAAFPNSIACASYCARILTHAPPTDALGQYVYAWLDLAASQPGPQVPALIDNVVTLLESAELSDPDESQYVLEHVINIWHQGVISTALSAYVAEYVPQSAIDEEAVYAQLSSAREDVQAAAFCLLSRRIDAKVQELSVQLDLVDYNELDSSIQLSSTLASMLATPPHYVDDSNKTLHAERTWLLAWLLALRHLADASSLLRAYWTAPLPSMADILTFVGDEVAHSGKSLALWDLTQLFLSDCLPPLHLLCAHWWYMALITVPAEVRLWWTGCRDRDLCGRIETTTASIYTPEIVTRELSNMPAATPDLAIKVFRTSTGASVTARYAVDATDGLELSLTIPVAYPLKPVAVVGGERVAVPERTWRAWLLGVSMAPSVPDAISNFARNAQLHLSGVSECAICYSIVAHGTLPTKPCRTCKHKFHGACLYKWFSTSPQSTCPLCRSMF